jgi:hypothetical protein
MHIEVLVEDSSGKRLLEGLMPQFVGPYGEIHTWRLHSYKGVGRIPQNLNAVGDPAKRILLDQLPRLLRGYGKTPGVDAVVVIVDTDRRNCVEFLQELTEMSRACNSGIRTLFRLAVEEIEAWYLGDREALLAAYPRANKQAIAGYNQDSICGTWELLADAVYPGGSEEIKKVGWPLPGQIKHEWAEKIGPHMDPARNVSPSFRKLRNGLMRLVGSP